MKLKNDLEPYVAEEQEIINMFSAVFNLVIDQVDSWDDLPDELQNVCPKELFNKITE
jgi:hypothetical protein